MTVGGLDRGIAWPEDNHKGNNDKDNLGWGDEQEGK